MFADVETIDLDGGQRACGRVHRSARRAVARAARRTDTRRTMWARSPLRRPPSGCGSSRLPGPARGSKTSLPRSAGWSPGPALRGYREPEGEGYSEGGWDQAGVDAILENNAI